MPKLGFLNDLFGAGGVADAVVKVLTGAGVLKDPEQVRLATEAMYRFQSEIADKEIRVIEAINATMREEAKSEHWAQWLWRPFVGFTFAGVIINNFILVPYLAKYGVLVLSIPGEVWSAMLVVLGAAAFTRGAEKVADKWRNGNGK